jgi:hypothetical protein
MCAAQIASGVVSLESFRVDSAHLILRAKVGSTFNSGRKSERKQFAGASDQGDVLAKNPTSICLPSPRV